MSDVVVVNMPYSAIEHPSIALGYFEASLPQRGIDVYTLSANIYFAQEIGVRDYFLFSNYYNTDLLGEWTFAEVAFPEFKPDSEQYFSCLTLPIPESKIKRVRALTHDYIERMADMVLAQDPRIVGCSSIFQQNVASLALLRKIRERAPEVITVMGGANCEGPMGRALIRCFDWVDYAFSGEADDLFPSFCEVALAEADRGAAMSAIGGWAPDAVYRRDDRRLQLNGSSPARAVVDDLSTVPCPKYDDYFRDLHDAGVAHQVLPGLLLESSRGCWWGAKKICTFCGLNGEYINFRSKPPEMVLDEIRALHARYGITAFEVVDNILDMEYFKTLLPALAESEQKYGFLYEIKANLRRDQVELLAEAGIRWVQPGIESLEDGVLELIRKGVTAAQNVQLLKWCREKGIFVIWNYLSEIPDEKDEWHAELLELIPKLVHLQPPSAPGSPLRFDRFSVYFNEPEQHGLELEPVWTYSHVYPVAPSDIAQLAYFFDNIRPSPFDTEERPLWRAAQAELVTWRNLHYACSEDEVWAEVNEGQPMLSQRWYGDEALVLTDTRPCAKRHVTELNGLAAAVYEACDQARTLDGVVNACRAAGFPGADEDAVRAVLDQLIDDTTLVHLSGRYLSLAVREPWDPYPPMEVFPGGRVLLKRAPAPKRPQDLTVADMFNLKL